MNEFIVDRRIASAVKHAQESNKHLFIAGYQAAKVYGLFQEHATNEIARQAGKSRSAVRNWVYGYRCFQGILSVNCNLAKHYRRTFSLSHFTAMYELAQKYNLDAKVQLYYFGIPQDYLHNGQPHSVDVLRQEIDADRNWKGAVDWRWYMKRLKSGVFALLTFDSELPERVKDWAREGEQIMKEAE